MSGLPGLVSVNPIVRGGKVAASLLFLRCKRLDQARHYYSTYRRFALATAPIEKKMLPSDLAEATKQTTCVSYFLHKKYSLIESVMLAKYCVATSGTASVFSSELCAEAGTCQLRRDHASGRINFLFGMLSQNLPGSAYAARNIVPLEQHAVLNQWLSRHEHGDSSLRVQETEEKRCCQHSAPRLF